MARELATRRNTVPLPARTADPCGCASAALVLSLLQPAIDCTMARLTVIASAVMLLVCVAATNCQWMPNMPLAFSTDYKLVYPTAFPGKVFPGTICLQSGAYALRPAVLFPSQRSLSATMDHFRFLDEPSGIFAPSFVSAAFMKQAEIKSFSNSIILISTLVHTMVAYN